jgi:hypothetical protein
LLVVILAVGGYMGLTALLGVREYWAGFLFLLQWGMMEQLKIDHLPKSALGAATGAAIAFLPAWLTPALGLVGAGAAMTVAILAATFCLILGKAPIIVNAATMLFLTILSIPHLAAQVRSIDVYAGLAAGVLFFGGLAALATWAQGRSAVRSRASGYAS